MEGSSYASEVKNYEVLSAYYDELLIGDNDYSQWFAYIDKKPFNSVLELASGSGILAQKLFDRGLDVTASDLSQSMRNIALKNGFKGHYEILNMTDYDLGKTFDLILCVLDSVNYLEEDELDSFFACAYKHLNKGGRLIFDCHNMKRIREFADEYIEEGELSDGTPYQWSIQSDAYQNTLLENFVFYTEKGIVLEHHQQTVFSPELMQEKAQQAGFAVHYINDFIEDEKDLLIGEKI